MGKTKYQVLWQTKFPWLSRVASDLYSANHSFISTNGNAEKYRLMFDQRNPVASAYRMCETKVSYVIKFGIAQSFRRKLIKDFVDTSFSFLFDETTNSRVRNSMTDVLCTDLNGMVELFTDTVAVVCRL